MARLTPSLLVFMAWLPLSISAKEQKSNERYSFEQKTAVEQSTPSPTGERIWELFYLTEDDWKKYEQIKKGLRGYWSANLDPITTLGVEAQTEQERRRYARILAIVENDRVEREVAFEVIFQEEYNKLFPQKPIFDQEKLDAFDLRYNTPQGASQLSPLPQAPVNERLIYITSFDRDCADCDADIAKVLSRYGDRAIDIYFVNSKGDDTKIRQFALKHNIPLAKIVNGQIRLRHDSDGAYERKVNGTLPLLLNSPTE